MLPQNHNLRMYDDIQIQVPPFNPSFMDNWNCFTWNNFYNIY